jgi:hypothetical protein
MEGVIPNSKVVILPPASSDEGAAWKRELYLRPGSWIPWVTVTVVVATVLLAVIVFVLHLNEKVSGYVTRGCVSTDSVCRGKTSWSADEHHIILILMRYSICVLRLGFWTCTSNLMAFYARPGHSTLHPPSQQKISEILSMQHTRPDFGSCSRGPKRWPYGLERQRTIDIL